VTCITQHKRHHTQGGATYHVKNKIVCSCSFSSAAAANDAAAANPERFTQSRIVAKRAAEYQARLVTKRGEQRTIDDTALACGNAVCELCDGHRFLDKTAKPLCASVGKADCVRFSLCSNLKKNDLNFFEKNMSIKSMQIKQEKPDDCVLTNLG
jgi:hypothetical protein